MMHRPKCPKCNSNQLAIVNGPPQCLECGWKQGVIDRPNWDEYFMEIAYVTAKRSTCPKRSVGSVIVQDRRIVATGYNGAPAGAPHCPGDGPEGHPSCIEHGHCVRTIHAEMNAIIACAAAGVKATGGTLYATAFPCPRCMGAIINAGIKRVIYAEGYSKMGVSLLIAREVGMEVEKLKSATGIE